MTNKGLWSFMKFQAAEQAVQCAQCLFYALGLTFCTCAKILTEMSHELLTQVITCCEVLTTDAFLVKYGLTRGP